MSEQAEELMMAALERYKQLEEDLVTVRKHRDYWEKLARERAQRIHTIEQQLKETERQWVEEYERAEDLEVALRQVTKEGLHKSKAKRTCPNPGGCEHCPNRPWCTVIRINSALTTAEEEARWLADNGQRGVYDMEFVDRNTPLEAHHEAR
jgi:chromosome segregation ATPase